MTISQPSVSRVLHEVLEALNQPDVVNRFCHYPTTIQELRNLRERCVFFFLKFCEVI